MNPVLTSEKVGLNNSVYTILAFIPQPTVVLPTQDGAGNTTQSFSTTINQPVSDDSISVVKHQFSNDTSTPVSVSGIPITNQQENKVFMLVKPLSSTQNSVVPGVAMNLPTQLVDMSPPPSVASSENSDVQEIEVVETPETCGSKKRKLYEFEEKFSDPGMEHRRQKAIIAKNHRDTKNQTIQNLQQKLKIVEQERDTLKQVNERQIFQIQQAHKAHVKEVENLKKEKEDIRQQLQASLVKEVENLKKEKEDMRQQLQALHQQYQDSLRLENIGFPDINFSFDL